MTVASDHRYLIAIGSNMRVPGIGNPRAVIAASLDDLAARGLNVCAVSTIVDSAPVGPSRRRYANAAAVVGTALSPPEVLALLQMAETRFGRTRRGSRWRSRPLDLDIVLWSGGVWVSGSLAIPHRLFRERDFVLHPAAEIAPHWRDPVSGFTLRQLNARVS